MKRELVEKIGDAEIHEERKPNGRGGWTFVGFYVVSPRGNDRQFPDYHSARAYAEVEDKASRA